MRNKWPKDFKQIEGRHLFPIFIRIIHTKACIFFSKYLTSLQRQFYVLQYAIALADSNKSSFWFSPVKLLWKASWTNTHLCFKIVKYSQNYQISQRKKKIFLCKHHLLSLLNIVPIEKIHLWLGSQHSITYQHIPEFCT